MKLDALGTALLLTSFYREIHDMYHYCYHLLILIRIHLHTMSLHPISWSSCSISSVNPVSCRCETVFSHFIFPSIHRLSGGSSFAETYFHNSFWDSVIEYPYYMLLGKVHFWFAPLMVHVLPLPSSLISSP